jgi:tetratricopeptide (TPR) repeat protein
MRKILLAGAAVCALSLAGAAPIATSADAAGQSLFAALCAQGGTGQSPWQVRLASMLTIAEAYAQTLPGDINAPPPLVAGLGNAHLPITTSAPLAQEYFDQGARYLHAFNHGEAIRAFRHAQRLDPNCAMCFWGEAFALGPNINAPMESTDHEPAYAAARRAHELRANATPLEQAFIDAIQTRYARTPPQDRSGLDAAFADAMAQAADRFPDNDLLQVLAAEAAMDTQPWDYWEPGGREPKGRAADAIRRVETVLARSPNNSGAIHLYIHLAEASTNPWRSEAAAERLARTAPQAGHLVHMPGHIYYRVGRFRDSIRANIEAVAADERYIASADPSPLYRYGYYPHNVHFVLASAAMGGDGRMALQYADKLDEAVPMEMAQAVVLAQPVKAAPWFARAQFADPHSVLAAPEPPAGVSYVTGAWRYARGEALIRLGRISEARIEAEALQALIQTGDFTALNDGGVPAQDVLGIYRRVLLARASMAERDYPAAIAELRQAVDAQARVPYTEPPYVYYPVRRTLGAAYLLNGQPAVAEMEFLSTLIESPNDAYAYWGLSEARRARGDRIGASAARQMFNAAFLGRRNSVSAMAL